MAPGYCFGVTLANINRYSILISYNCELNTRMSIILQIWDNFYVISWQVLNKKKQNNRRVYQDWTLVNPSIFRTLVYSEFWHTQNQRHIQKSGISKTLAHSDLEIYSKYWAIQNPVIFRTGSTLGTSSNIYDGALWETANGYGYFHRL